MITANQVHTMQFLLKHNIVLAAEYEDTGITRDLLQAWPINDSPTYI